MNDFFRNKVVAITGGSEGIGKALIDALIPLGAKVATTLYIKAAPVPKPINVHILGLRFTID